MLHSSTVSHVAANKFVWVAAILNDSEARGPHRYKWYGTYNVLAMLCIKSFKPKRVVRVSPLEPPLPTGLHRSVARVFRSGLHDMHVCIRKYARTRGVWGSGGMFHLEIIEN